MEGKRVADQAPRESGQSAPRFLPAGDGAVVVEFGSGVDAAVNDRVMALDAAVAAAAIGGVIETVPTYRSLQVVYDPLAIRAKDLVPRLQILVSGADRTRRARREWSVPVCYGQEYGEDLDWMAKTHGISTEEVVHLHTGSVYRVYMIGFMPGFAYLGGLPEQLHTPRRQDPRTRVPAGSIAIGGEQTAVFSIAAPSGWHMLGRTPARGFDLRREAPFLIDAGDLVRFHRITTAEFDRLDALAEKGETVTEFTEAA